MINFFLNPKQILFFNDRVKFFFINIRWFIIYNSFIHFLIFLIILCILSEIVNYFFWNLCYFWLFWWWSFSILAFRYILYYILINLIYFLIFFNKIIIITFFLSFLIYICSKWYLLCWLILDNIYLIFLRRSLLLIFH